MNPTDQEPLAAAPQGDGQDSPRFSFIDDKTLKQAPEPKLDFDLVQKRSGEIVNFDKRKISEAIFKAAQAVGGQDKSIAENLADQVVLFLSAGQGGQLPNVEEIQDAVEKVLIEKGHAKTAKAYILYRDQRAKVRRQNFDVRQESLGEAATI